MEISGVSSKAYTSAAQGVDEEEKVEEKNMWQLFTDLFKKGK